MATIYVGPTSAGAADGTSWANRYGSLNSAEDRPVAAGDEVVVGPGVYRELLTVDVSGSSGSPITYTADLSGARTDGVGGVVRITGSNDDQTATRANCITATSKDYRTFRGFSFDITTSHCISLATACGNWIIEDCYFSPLGPVASHILIAGTGTTNTIRRCVFVGNRSTFITFSHSSTVSGSAHVVENCIFLANVNRGINITRVGGITVRNNTFLACGGAIRVDTALAAGQTTTVNNNLLISNGTAMQAVTAPGTNEEITENYNALWGNSTDRSNVSTGANSNAFPPLFAPPIQLSGYKYPWSPFDLSQWSPVRRIAGTSMSSDGLYGITRPATDSKKSWGAVQYNDLARDTSTKRTGAASLKLADAGRHQMFVPTSNVSTVFSVYVQWEADYAGTKPQLVVKQPGQSDNTDTATGSSGNWEELSVTITPAASPGYCIVELVSNNTATSGNYDVFFDDLTVA